MSEKNKNIRPEKLKMADRREKVKEWVIIRRLSIKETAKMLGVTEDTISKDLKIIREETASAFKEAKCTGYLEQLMGQINESFAAQLKRLWMIADGVAAKDEEPPTMEARLKAHRLIKDIQKDLANILQDLGFVKRNLGTVDINVLEAIKKANEEMFGPSTEDKSVDKP